MHWIGVIPFLISLHWRAATAHRANVTLQLNLSNDIDPDCDESVYKVTVCAGEFTDRCKLRGPVTLYVQATCAAQGSTEPIHFPVQSVETPIELEITVQRIGEPSVQRLRRAEIWLTEGGEISVTSYDLSTIVRIKHFYKCLPNYFGKTCQKFCDLKAVEYVCDDTGNSVCRPGYFIDPKSGQCRLDQCAKHPNYCQNGGSCVANSDPIMDLPFCLCSSEFSGPRCENKRETTTVPQSPHSSEPTAAIRATNSYPTNRPIYLDGNSHPRGNRSSIDNRSIAASHSRLTDHQPNSQPVDTPSSEQSRVRVNSPTVGRDVEPMFKRIVLPVVVILLMLSLLIACIGFLIWVVLQRRTKNQSILKPDYPTTPQTFGDIPRRWASVDDSPTKIYSFGGRYLNNAVSCLPSINSEPFGMLPSKADMEPIYGMHGSLHPFGGHPFDQTSNCNIVNNLPWMDNSNCFSTLPHQFATLSRRHTTELGSFLANGSIYASPSVMHDRYLRSNTTSIIDPQLDHQIRRDRSIIRDSVPEETVVDYGDQSTLDECPESYKDDTEVRVTTSMPPPPKQFADTYMRSAC